MEKFKKQFNVHIVGPKNVMMLSSIKQMVGVTLQGYLTILNATTAVVHKSDSFIILMAVISQVANKTDVKLALERNLSVDLANSYYQVESYLRQEDAEAKNAVVNAVDDGGPFKKRY